MNPNSLRNLVPAKKGEIRNPKGKRTAGSFLREELNSIACRGYTSKQLKKIVTDEKSSWIRRAAAQRALRSMEQGDMKDFERFIEGTKSIAELAEEGIDTTLIKSSRVTPTQSGESRSIELHDRSKDEFDGIVGHTALTPAEAEKYARIDDGRPTELFEGVQITIPGLPTTK